MLSRIHSSRQVITRLVCNQSTRNMSGHSGEAPAKDMPAVAAFTSMDQVKQEQDLQGDQQQQQRAQQQQQQQAPPVPPARPTGALQDMDTNDLVAKRNQILWEQAVKGQQPGLSLMQVRQTPPAHTRAYVLQYIAQAAVACCLLSDAAGWLTVLSFNLAAAQICRTYQEQLFC
jgi:hypothetical protein